MKIKRYKKVNKNMSYYINNFGFRQPYQMLVDGTFCFAALNNQINIADNIPRYLQGELKLLTTACAIIEMEKLGGKLVGALMILKKYAVHKCGHETKPVTAAKCLLSMVKNDNEQHYVIATQDRDLQEKIRTKVGIPLVYLHGKTPVLEHPSDATMQAIKDKTAGISKIEREAIAKLKEKSGLVEEPKHRKKKKKKGANPLSCLKKKNKVHASGKVEKQDKSSSDKIKRKKVRIPKHVKEELLKNNKT